MIQDYGTQTGTVIGNRYSNCIFDYSNNSRSINNTFYAKDGIPTDIALRMDNFTDVYINTNVNNSDKIFCNDEWLTSCKINNYTTYENCDCYIPTFAPTISPSAVPTMNPSLSPTKNPTIAPSIAPTRNPTRVPTDIPTTAPSVAPTINPTRAPSDTPTTAPSIVPTRNRTRVPTHIPTIAPSMTPTMNPTRVPSSSPTYSPTNAPTSGPTETEVTQTIYFYYNDPAVLDNVLQLSFARYAKELVNATQEAMRRMLNKTLLHSICNQTSLCNQRN